jgi:8-oxo-dGTP pyrophosphatase MutT (NUDIX family)
MAKPFETPVVFARLNLPDMSMAMQRRTHDAPTSPNKLQFFGGHVEEGETMLGAAKRELDEETDLPVDELDIKEVGLFYVPKAEGFKRVVGLVQAHIQTAQFKDFEGQGTPEIWTPEGALESGQLITSVRYILEKLVNVVTVPEG